jgi:hypothetical protein
MEFTKITTKTKRKWRSKRGKESKSDYILNWVASQAALVFYVLQPDGTYIK